MTQKEIMKKAKIYGIAAVLLAVLLVTMIYSANILPFLNGTNGIEPPLASPSPSVGDEFPTDPVLSDISGMKTFSSYDELREFLKGDSVEPAVEVWRTGALGDSAPSAAYSLYSLKGGSDQDYSTTNVQVEGVDEADIVKTDGEYLYLIANNTVFIVQADSQEAKIYAKIASNENIHFRGLFLKGDKLAVIGSEFKPYILPGNGDVDGPTILPIWSSGETFVHIYDVSNKNTPVLKRDVAVSGYYVNSRMIDDYIYLITNEHILIYDDVINLPLISTDDRCFEVEPSTIYYTEDYKEYNSYTTFVSLNISDDQQEPTSMTLMMGHSSTVYVSLNNIYVTYPVWNENLQSTVIYRIQIEQNSMTAKAQGSVLGRVLNQFSMDEYEGYFRIATTCWITDDATTQDGRVFRVSRQINSLYVLDADLEIVGELESFQEDETIYSARFMGDKCYVVTFEQIDPFFIIDLSNPKAPKVSGELKIPGYSSYLHPYDENHIIGIGKENNTVKLSLFDVNDVNDPKEIKRYHVDASWSDSISLYEHKAVLFDKQRQLLVIPISITNYGSLVTPEVSVENGRRSPMDSYVTADRWEGVFVFNITPEDGFELKEKISHVKEGLIDEQTQDIYYSLHQYQIFRSLYIGNNLYTISNMAVQINDLHTLEIVNNVELK